MNSSRHQIARLMIIVAINAAGLQLATQWAAAMMGNQPRLGAPVLMLGDWPVYHPLSLFLWWFRYADYVPYVFDAAGAVCVCAFIASCVVALGFSFWSRRTSQQATTYGSARWASHAEIVAAGLLGDDGVFLGCHRRRHLRHSGAEHVLAFAPTRSGKGVGLVVPTLLTWPGSVIVHDIKGENWALTAGWRSLGSHCLYFNPTDPRSAGFNPLLEVRKGRNEVRDVQNIADMLIDPEGALERPNHWDRTSHSLLVGAMLHILYAEQDKSLAGLANFLSRPGASFVATLRHMRQSNHLGSETEPRTHPVIAETAQELLNKSENELSGVLSTALSYVTMYRDPVVAEVTRRSDWRIADLLGGRNPVSLYLVVPPSDIERTRPLIRLMINQISRRLTESEIVETGTGRQLLVMLDEFPALGRLEFFETALGYVASYGIRCFLIAQSLNQIEKVYGANNAILDHCHVRVTFATNDERTARRISDALGTTTELRAMQNHSGPRMSLWLPNISVSHQETARQLMTISEVMQLPAAEAIILMEGRPPIRATKLRYHKDPQLKRRQLPPPPLVEGRYDDCPPQRRHDWHDADCPGSVQPSLPVSTLPQPERGKIAEQGELALHPNHPAPASVAADKAPAKPAPGSSADQPLDSLRHARDLDAARQQMVAKPQDRGQQP